MNNIRKRRREIDITQEALASLIGTSKSYICELERDRVRNPSLGKARLLAMALRCPVDDLFPKEQQK